MTKATQHQKQEIAQHAWDERQDKAKQSVGVTTRQKINKGLPNPEPDPCPLTLPTCRAGRSKAGAQKEPPNPRFHHTFAKKMPWRQVKMRRNKKRRQNTRQYYTRHDNTIQPNKKKEHKRWLQNTHTHTVKNKNKNQNQSKCGPS